LKPGREESDKSGWGRIRHLMGNGFKDANAELPELRKEQ